MFWLVVKDDAKKLSSIEGATNNDIAFTALVAELQEKGAPIRCETPSKKSYPTKELLIKALKSIGFEYTDNSILHYYEQKLL